LENVASIFTEGGQLFPIPPLMAVSWPTRLPALQYRILESLPQDLQYAGTSANFHT